MKTCTKCHTDKPDSGFYPERAQCIECILRRNREYKKHYRATARGQAKRVEDCRVNRLRYPVKYRARWMAAKQIAVEGPCHVCHERPAEERHHPDYSKPLEVVLVCKPCHRALDAQASACHAVHLSTSRKDNT